MQKERQDSLHYDSVLSSTAHDQRSSTLVPKDNLAQTSRTTQQRFWQSVDRSKPKPYTARPVPPLLVADLKNFQPKEDTSFQMTQDSIHSEADEKEKPRQKTIQSTRDKVQTMVSHNLSVRSQKSNRTTQQNFFSRKAHVQKLDLNRFTLA